MASRNSSLTELETNFPTLRLRLTNQAADLSRSRYRPQEQGIVQQARNYYNKMFTKAREGLTLEEGSSEGVRRRNKERLKQYFDKMHGGLYDQERNVMKEMDTMTPEQQEDVVFFWGSVANFFAELLDWLKNMFNAIVEKIRQGWRLVKEAVKEVFETITGLLKAIF